MDNKIDLMSFTLFWYLSIIVSYAMINIFFGSAVAWRFMPLYIIILAVGYFGGVALDAKQNQEDNLMW